MRLRLRGAVTGTGGRGSGLGAGAFRRRHGLAGLPGRRSAAHRSYRRNRSRSSLWRDSRRRVRRNSSRHQVRRLRRSGCSNSSSGLFYMPELTAHLPAIALTMGDPAGVGPEIVIKALADPQVAPLARWIVVGDARILERAERVTGLKLQAAELRDVRTLTGIEEFAFGRLDARCGVAA